MGTRVGGEPGYRTTHVSRTRGNFASPETSWAESIERLAVEEDRAAGRTFCTLQRPVSQAAWAVGS